MRIAFLLSWLFLGGCMPPSRIQAFSIPSRLPHVQSQTGGGAATSPGLPASNLNTYLPRKGSPRRQPEEFDNQRIFQDCEKMLHGKRFFDDSKVVFNFTDANIDNKDLFPDAPPLTYQKYLTMQEKRVVVSFRFTDVPYLRPYFLTFASRLKKKHSDIIIERNVLPLVESTTQPIFEVLVDGKTVIGGGSNGRERHILGGRVDVQNTQSVFVSMEHLGLAISKARKKRRPTSVYGEDDDMHYSPRRRHRSSFLWFFEMERENIIGKQMC